VMEALPCDGADVGEMNCRRPTDPPPWPFQTHRPGRRSCRRRLPERIPVSSRQRHRRVLDTQAAIALSAILAHSTNGAKSENERQKTSVDRPSAARQYVVCR
jgi:hypothetical protein